MHNCKGAGLSRSESGTFYLYTVIILLSSCFFIPTAVLFYKPAVRSSLPCAHNSSGSVGLFNGVRRLQLLYGEQAAIAFTNNRRGGGARVELFLPIDPVLQKKEGETA